LMPEVKRLGTRIAIIVEFNCEVFVGSRSEPRRTGLTCDAPLALRRKEPLRKAGATSPIGRFIPLNPRDGAEVAFWRSEKSPSLVRNAWTGTRAIHAKFKERKKEEHFAARVRRC